jgi:hypothetical protein
MNANVLTSLQAFKSYIDSDTTGLDDDLLSYFLQTASDDIEHYVHRKLRRKTHTEYQKGNLQKKIFTRQYPIISVTGLWDDTLRVYGDDTKFLSSEYFVDKETGMIQLFGEVFDYGVSNIKIVYDAGYDDFEILEDVNDRFDFSEGSTEFNITLTEGIYTGSGLASHIQELMNTEAVSGVYEVLFNRITGQFRISDTDEGTFKILFLTGANNFYSCNAVLGFDKLDKEEASTYTSDNPVLGIPKDLEIACLKLSYFRFLESPRGQDRFGLKSKQINTQSGGGGTTSYNQDDLPQEVARILQPYVRQDWVY